MGPPGPGGPGRAPGIGAPGGVPPGPPGGPPIAACCAMAMRRLISSLRGIVERSTSTSAAICLGMTPALTSSMPSSNCAWRNVEEAGASSMATR